MDPLRVSAQLKNWEGKPAPADWEGSVSVGAAAGLAAQWAAL